MEKYQDNLEIQSRILEGELGHYKASNKRLQFEMEKETYFNGITQKDNCYFKERIRELIAQNEELKTERQKMDQDLLERDEEISRLKNHSEKLLTQIKNSRDTKQRVQELEQENQDLGKKLSGNDEEASRLKNLNKKLLEQIKILKDERKKNLESKNKDDKSEDKEELLRLKRHNQDLLTQIKRFKHDKKSLQEELDHKTSIIDEETMTEPMELKKSLDVKVSILDKGINIEPINLTNQKDVNPIDVKRSSNVEEEIIQGHEENSISKVNQQKTTSIRSKDRVTRMPYQHPNHKNQYFSQSMYQHKQIPAMSKNITSTTSEGQNRSDHGSRNVSSSFQEPYKNPNPQKIELRRADSFTIRQFCSVLRSSYCLKSSTITNSRMTNQKTINTS
jgi:chromosome segregation ATPase